MNRLHALAATLPEWLTYAQAGALADGMSRDSLRYYIKQKRIAATKRRKKFSSRAYYVLINKQSLLAFLEAIQEESHNIPILPQAR